MGNVLLDEIVRERAPACRAASRQLGRAPRTMTTWKTPVLTLEEDAKSAELSCSIHTIVLCQGYYSDPQRHLSLLVPVVGTRRMLTGQNCLRDKLRTVEMHMEIGCFVSCLFGWILVCSTVPTPFWSYSENAGSVLTSGDAFSNLWQDCLSDSTGSTACKGYPSLMALSVFLHTCRALTISAVIAGFFGNVLTLIGMKCTKIGGSVVANARVTFSGGITYLVAGFCGMITFSWWANKTRVEYVDPQFMGAKHELGAAIFIGWGGSILLILGGAVLTYISGKEALSSRDAGHQSPGSHATGRTRLTYVMPASLPRVTLAAPLLYEGRQSRTSSATTRMGRAYSRDDFV